jgi:hypothetical protein
MHPLSSNLKINKYYFFLYSAIIISKEIQRGAERVLPDAISRRNPVKSKAVFVFLFCLFLTASCTAASIRDRMYYSTFVTACQQFYRTHQRWPGDFNELKDFSDGLKDPYPLVNYHDVSFYPLSGDKCKARARYVSPDTGKEISFTGTFNSRGL